jgi:hypothetical protein
MRRGGIMFHPQTLKHLFGTNCWASSTIYFWILQVSLIPVIHFLYLTQNISHGSTCRTLPEPEDSSPPFQMHDTKLYIRYNARYSSIHIFYKKGMTFHWLGINPLPAYRYYIGAYTVKPSNFELAMDGGHKREWPMILFGEPWYLHYSLLTTWCLFVVRKKIDSGCLIYIHTSLGTAAKNDTAKTTA